MKFNYLRFTLLVTLAFAGVSCHPESEKEKSVEVTGVSVMPLTKTLNEGETCQLEATVIPADASDRTVEWSSNDDKVAVVNADGLVTAIAPGSTSITVTTRDGGYSARCRVSVTDPVIHVKGISLDQTSISLRARETLVMAAKIEPENADDQAVTWSSSEDGIASVENGEVTAIAPGSAVITVTTHEGGFTAQCTVTVLDSDQAWRTWPDTGSEVPVYPSYQPVQKLEDFPRIDLRTASGQPVQSKTEYEEGTVSLYDPQQMYSGVTELKDLKMKIRGRGNTTWEGPWGNKNPYRFKLDKKNKLFGMKGDKDWILLSDKFDPTLMRTATALQISRLVSMPWTPDFRVVELYFNGKYAGVYYLVEQKEPDRENKVPITVAVPGEVDGGYLLELDDKEDDDAYFWSATFGKKVKYKDPDPNDSKPEERMTAEQKAYITDYFNLVERKLANREFTGADSYKDYIEMDSWIQNFFVHEVSMNIDGNMRLSTYFAKDRDTRLFMPFVWDFDRAFGNASYQVGDFALPQAWPQGWFVRIRGGYPGSNYGRKPSWYQYLFEDPVFVARVKELWVLYKPRLDTVPEYMDAILEYNRLALEHNDTKFYNNYASKVKTLRREYIQRLEWLDKNIGSLKAQRYNSSTGSFVDLQ